MGLCIPCWKSMKVFGACCILLLVAGAASPATTINSANNYAYGANIGWVDWRGDVSSGAVIGEFTCSGYIYSANVGWINLGSGSPANGIRYLNNSANDFGVNHDGAGNLSGYAWGANIGWVTFTNRDAAGASYAAPKVDLLTGKLSGYIYGANVGWISLSNAFACVQTDSIRMGPDSDGDGLPDDWELSGAGNLTTLNGTGDADGDGLTDAQEYIADTNPLDPNSGLRITQFMASSSGTLDTITWASRPSRNYRIVEKLSLGSGGSWTDIGLGAIPGASGTTTRSFSDGPSFQNFFRVQAVFPLSP